MIRPAVLTDDFSATNSLPEKSDIWVLTAYFNPVGYRSRYRNFQIFRRSLNAPLITVELSFNDSFELDPEDSTALIRRKSPDVMWQKERLLNIALSMVPEECRYVVWIDCDVVIRSPSWIRRVREQLNQHQMVQLYRKVAHVRKGTGKTTVERKEVLFEETSVVSYIRGRDPEKPDLELTRSRRQRGLCNGMAWAARRNLLNAHGFYDGSIAGGGDTAIASAAFGQMDAAIAYHGMNGDQIKYYLDWAAPFAKKDGFCMLSPDPKQQKPEQYAPCALPRKNCPDAKRAPAPGARADLCDRVETMS